METQDKDNSRNHRPVATPNANQSRSNDEREKANKGDWEGQRDKSGTTESYDTDTNDNTGGAGSTGSAATNS